jgi:uncharacterized alkaline shock family protein YloU
MANLKRTAPPRESGMIKATNDGSDWGSIQISEDVVAAIVRRYAMAVPGVARLGGQSLVGGLAQLVGKRLNDRSIVVEVERELVNITVTIVVKFGEHVPSVATVVQSMTRKYVEELTGQRVGQVNVTVAGLEGEEQAGGEVERPNELGEM